MKLVLYNAPIGSYRSAEEHIGLASLAAVAEKNNVETILIDSPAMGLTSIEHDLMLYNACINAQVLGITLYISTYKAALGAFLY